MSGTAHFSFTEVLVTLETRGLEGSLGGPEKREEEYGEALRGGRGSIY